MLMLQLVVMWILCATIWFMNPYDYTNYFGWACVGYALYRAYKTYKAFVERNELIRELAKSNTA